MPRGKDESPVIRVYTVCDESRYMIVRNVPALGCGDELSKLFGSYGEIEQCTPMDAEDCEPFTDVYWIKFSQVKSARFAKRKLDESVFLGNKLQVSYAPQFESLADTKEKLEGRRKEVIGRARSGRADASVQHLPAQDPSVSNAKPRDYVKSGRVIHFENASIGHVSSDKDYFSSSSMNQTVRFVREKLDKIQSSAQQAGPASKKTRVDNRRRI